MWLLLLCIAQSVLTKAIDYHSALGYACAVNEHCVGSVPNSICFNRKCACRFGFKADGLFRCVHRMRHRRQANFGIRMLGDDCESNDQCRRTPVDGTKGCIMNQCQCSSDHVPVDAYRCIRDLEQVPTEGQAAQQADDELPGYGSVCRNNSDCQQSTRKLECLRGSCACLEGYVPLGKYLCYNIGGDDSLDIETSTVVLVSSTPMLSFDLYDSGIVDTLGNLGNRCTNDDYCRQRVLQSHCFNRTCTCLRGFIPLDSFTCVKDTHRDVIGTTRTTTTVPLNVDYKSLLGGKCSTNQNCHSANAACMKSLCTCPRHYFAIDEWTCLKDSDDSREDSMEAASSSSSTTTTTTTGTTSIIWWPWSSSTTRRTAVDLKHTFRFRCLLNRQCARVDANSHCTISGRCVCNTGYKLEVINEEQHCTRDMKADDCD